MIQIGAYEELWMCNQSGSCDDKKTREVEHRGGNAPMKNFHRGWTRSFTESANVVGVAF